MLIPRDASVKIKDLSRQFPIVAVVGVRQSGKSTLARISFPNHRYVSLEDPDVRQAALEDPRGFLADLSKGAVIDEAQRAPEIFSYLQTLADENRRPGRFILTGSQNFLLMRGVSQSLAGRATYLTLPPLSLSEIKGRLKTMDYEEALFRGLFPALHERRRTPLDWHRNYIRTYVERDVRELRNVGNLMDFQRFVQMCAARTGQLVNMASLSSDLGVAQNTIKAWLSILEAGGIIFFLRPYHRNFNKQIIRSPKLYFSDVGLASYLLGIETPEQMKTHPFRGALFETLVVGELHKARWNRGLDPKCWFWRDKTGHEVDCLIERAGKTIPVEIKSARTVVDDFFQGMSYWNRLSGNDPAHGYVVYGGDDVQKRKGGTVLSWKSLDLLGRTH